jgi:hypothetical protein
MPAERVIKYETINRNQLWMTALDIETLIPGDHIASDLEAVREARLVGVRNQHPEF